MLENFMAPPELKLKVGAQVMLIKNINEFMVNGTMGKVVDFRDPGSWESSGGEELAKLEGKNTNMTAKTSQKGGVLYPVVEFLQVNSPPRKVLVEPEVFKVELPNGEVQVSRSQVRRDILSNWTRLMRYHSFRLSWPGLCRYTRVKARHWSASRSIWLRCSRKVCAISFCGSARPMLTPYRTSICCTVARDISRGIASSKF